MSRHTGVSTFLNGGMIIKTDLNFTAVSFVIQQNLNIKQSQLYTVCPIILSAYFVDNYQKLIVMNQKCITWPNWKMKM